MSDAIEQQGSKHTKSTTVLIQPLYHSIHQPDRSGTKLLRQSSVAVPLQFLCTLQPPKHPTDRVAHHFTRTITREIPRFLDRALFLNERHSTSAFLLI